VSDDTPATPADVSAGDRIAGYRLEEQIGRGGMAVVYRALDERLDRRVALKLLAPGLANDTAFRTRFIRESRAAAAVDHPNIIPVYDAGDAGGFLFISMRYVQGGDVRSLIADGNPLSPARAWNIITQVAAALDAAHEHGLVHRDVKPANMLLDAQSNTNLPRRPDDDSHDHVYLSDFGISKRTVASNLTSTGQFVGTLDYIAPEQVEGHAIDGRTDQYSLACTAFELLSGIPPFRRSLGLALINAHLSEAPPSLVARRPELAPSIDVVLAKAMAKSPAQRYATCLQFAMDLGRALGLASGGLEAGLLLPGTGGEGSGGPARFWPATELADPAPVVPAGPGAAIPAAAAQDPSTMLAGGQTPAGQKWSPGQQPTGQQTPPGQYPPAQYQQGQYPPAQYQQGQYQQGQYQQGTNQQGQFPPGQYQQGTNQQGQFPPGQYPPAQYPPPQPARRSRGLIVGAVIGIVVVVAGAAAVALGVVGTGKHHGSGQSSSPPVSPSRSSSPSPSQSSSSPATSAAAQASAVSNLLSSSEATRGELQPAVSDIQDNCSALSSAQLASDVSTIKAVAMQRTSEYNQALGLQTGALPNGAELKTDLLNALQASLNADNDYLTWAQQEQSGCFPATSSTAFNDAGNADVQAVDAKTSFANLWNTIAPQYGQPTVSQGDI
jgi:Protein kinase domain